MRSCLDTTGNFDTGDERDEWMMIMMVKMTEWLLL